MRPEHRYELIIYWSDEDAAFIGGRAQPAHPGATGPRPKFFSRGVDAPAACPQSLVLIQGFLHVPSVPGRENHTMNLQLTPVFQRVPEAYIALVEELPGANTQGCTRAEARENLDEAIRMVLDANRVLAEERREVIDR